MLLLNLCICEEECIVMINQTYKYWKKKCAIFHFYALDFPLTIKVTLPLKYEDLRFKWFLWLKHVKKEMLKPLKHA